LFLVNSRFLQSWFLALLGFGLVLERGVWGERLHPMHGMHTPQGRPASLLSSTNCNSIALLIGYRRGQNLAHPPNLKLSDRHNYYPLISIMHVMCE
jgi:hypothetical protein